MALVPIPLAQAVLREMAEAPKCRNKTKEGAVVTDELKQIEEADQAFLRVIADGDFGAVTRDDNSCLPVAASRRSERWAAGEPRATSGQ